MSERWKNDSLYINNEFVMDGNNSAPLCRGNSKNQEHIKVRDYMQQVLTHHVKIGPVTGTEVNKSAGTLDVEYRHNTQEIRSPGCEYHKKLSNTHDIFFIAESESRVITAVNMLRATTSTRNKFTIANQKICAKAKAYTNRFRPTSFGN